MLKRNGEIKSLLILNKIISNTSKIYLNKKLVNKMILPRKIK
jgi:hypothetical protein